MADALKTDGDLTNAAGDGPVSLKFQTAAKVWAHITGGGTPSIADSLNASSVTDNGTGDRTINLTNDMANATYLYDGLCSNGVSSNTEIVTVPAAASVISVSSYRYITRDTAAVKDMAEWDATQAIGDLA